MLSFKSLTVIFWTLSTIFDVYVGAAPPCPETIDIAGGGLPNGAFPTAISESGIKEIQLALFLENLEVSFFTGGSANITNWGIGGYSNDSIEIVRKVAAVSTLSARTSRSR
jgi:hypothetical protein